LDSTRLDFPVRKQWEQEERSNRVENQLEKLNAVQSTQEAAIERMLASVSTGNESDNEENHDALELDFDVEEPNYDNQSPSQDISPGRETPEREYIPPTPIRTPQRVLNAVNRGFGKRIRRPKVIYTPPSQVKRRRKG
jgi:hypothetical protein